jgi:hypothetical protein
VASAVLAPEHRAPYLGPQGAWTRGNAAVSALFAATSLGGLVLAWVGASGETRMEGVVPWLVLAVAAFAVGGLAGATWLGRGLRSIRTERVALRRRLLVMDVGSRTATAAAQESWVMAPGMTRVHRPGCEYVRGKTVREVSPEAAPACVVCAEAAR